MVFKQNIEFYFFIQEHLAERGEQNPAILSELERTLALLAFDDPEKSPFGDLLHPSHRQRGKTVITISFYYMITLFYAENYSC